MSIGKVMAGCECISEVCEEHGLCMVARLAEVERERDEARHDLARLKKSETQAINDLAKAHARVAEVKAQEWQPIATAPRDGTWFLAWYPPEESDPGFCDTAQWVPWPREMNGDSWTIGGLDPTHWMPLPEPPK